MRPTRTELIELLKKLTQETSGVELLILFGSYAEDKAMPISDIDLAIITKDPQATSELRYNLAKTLKIPEDKISIIDLENAPPTLKIKILKKGITILGNPNPIAKTIKPDTIEVLQHQKTQFYNWLKSENPIDENVITSIITQVESDIRFLNKITKEKTPNQIIKDETLRRALERALHTAIEGTIDLLRHIISGLNLGIAEYYRDYIQISINNNLISQKTGTKLLKLAELRHKLVHRYQGLNYDQLIKEAKNLIELWPQVSNEVKKYLRKHLKTKPNQEKDHPQ
ncbi:MAG: DUF86 domain-containing protein [Thermoprotei archaeon]|nr:DUF86 domain-containing protein [Thermoprotei archaeon]